MKPQRLNGSHKTQIAYTEIPIKIPTRRCMPCDTLGVRYMKPVIAEYITAVETIGGKVNMTRPATENRMLLFATQAAKISKMIL